MTRHPDAMMVLVLLAITLALFVPVLVQPDGLIYPPRSEFTDLTVTHWPNIQFAVENLRATGHLPLWRPAIMSGTPFAANPLSGLHYVPHAIFLVLPLAIGFNVLFIAHVWLGGGGAYALLRAWQVERPAAFVGALTWMATPKLFAHLGAGHVGMVEAVAWMPLAVLAAHRLVERRRATLAPCPMPLGLPRGVDCPGVTRSAGVDAVWLGAVWAIQFMADPRTCFYTIALSGTYGLAAAVLTLKTSRQVVLSLCLCGLVTLVILAVLSAALWLPLAELITQSNRGGLTLAEAGEWSLPFRQLVGLLLANWGGFHEWTVYVGVMPLMLAVAGCKTRRARAEGRGWQNWLSAFLWLAIVLAALFSLGTNGPLFPLLFRSVPGLALLRVPPRAWFIVAFATACLCAFGVQEMMHQVHKPLVSPSGKPRGWVTLAGVALAAMTLMFGLGGFFVLLGHPEMAFARASMLHMGLVVPASVMVMLLRAQGRIGARGFAILSAVAIAATLLPVDWSFYRVVPEARAFADHADVAAWLESRARPGTFRVYSPSYSLPQHVAQRAGLELADGVDPLQLASYADLMRTATGTRSSGYSVTIPAFPPESNVETALRDATPDARLLGKLNVRYIAAEFPIRAEGLVERAHIGSTFVYENQFAMPRAFVGETGARIVTFTSDRVVVEADGPGRLTLSQVNYPGWRATVDGRPASILSVDALMAVSLDAGHHRVEFVFDPWTVKVGWRVSVVGWVGVMVGWLAGWLKRRARQWNHVTG